MNFETTTTFPAGEYVIIDPCYVLHDEWKEICNDFFFADRTDGGYNEGEFTLTDGRRLFIGNTKRGDGMYSIRDSKGSESAVIGVDAGCIGLIDVTHVDQSNYKNNINLGYIVEFKSEFTVTVKDGYFEIDEYYIDTDEEIDEDDDYYNYYPTESF